jgi:hypothetical protein
MTKFILANTILGSWRYGDALRTEDRAARRSVQSADASPLRMAYSAAWVRLETPS